MLDLATRRRICEDTIFRSADLARATPSGSLESSFVTLSKSPALSKQSPGFPNLELVPIRILDSDTFACARGMLASDPALQGKIAVLNLASDQEPGGGWRYTISITQEEALCYSSTLYATLNTEYYPWPNRGAGSAAGVFSPGVVVFRDTLDNDLVDLKEAERFVVSVVTVAAPFQPQLTSDGLGFAKESDVEELREKVRLILRVAATNGKTGLVLGAMGCGVYRCPPELVARVMREVTEENEFEGWFGNVVFAIRGRGKVGQRNLEAFRKEFGTR